MSPVTAALTTIAVRALLLGAGAFAIWNIARDLRTAWPHIVAALTEEEPTDDDT